MPPTYVILRNKMNNNNSISTTTPSTDFQALSLNVVKQIDFFVLSHIPIFLAMLCCSTLLAYITVKNGSLHKHQCLIMIALEAVINTGREFFHVIFALVTFFVPSGLVPFGLCCGLLQAVLVLFAQSSAVCMLMIAGDRLCAILFPFWYSRWSERKFAYFMAFLCLCVANSAFRIVDQFIAVFNFTGERGVICQTAACNSNFVTTVYTRVNLFLYAITIAAYLAFFAVYHWKIVKVKVKQQTHHHHNNQQQQQQFSESTRLYSALVIMCILYSVGLLVNLFALAIQWQWIFAQMTPNQLSLFSKMYSLSNSLINLFFTPLLFIFSSKYRQALKTVNILCRDAPQSTPQIMTINNQASINRQSNIMQRIKRPPTRR